MVKLSIITINRNNATGLRKTMESVFSQTYRDFEYIVVDGASTDESVEVINELARERVNELKNFTWISEPDTGIYNAMNKGVRMCCGEYTLMLNSGDYLVDEHVIERIMPELDGTDIIQGNHIENRAGELFRNRGCGRSEIDMIDVMKGHFLHQASFCKRDLFDRFGYYDESYRMIADTKFFMKCLGIHDASFKYIDVDVANYDITGISAETTGRWAECHESEALRLRKEIFSDRLYAFLYENDKKIRLYNDLHAHKWIWYMTMAVAHINNWFYKGKR